MNAPIESIENLAKNFDNMTSDILFMKEKITNFYFQNKLQINFEVCHIDISRNECIIVIC